MMTCTTLMTMAAAMAFIATAAPLEVEERQIGLQTANFDDLTTPTVVSVNSVGVYQGLNYTGLSLATQGTSGFAGLPPQTPKNDIYYSSISGFTPAGGPPQVTIPTNSVGFFTPISLYFGCTVAAPVACRFTVTGSRNNVQTAQQSFEFTAKAALQQARLTELGFAGVDKIQFSTTYTPFGIQEPLGSTVLDSFSYVILAA